MMRPILLSLTALGVLAAGAFTFNEILPVSEEAKITLRDIKARLAGELSPVASRAEPQKPGPVRAATALDGALAPAVTVVRATLGELQETALVTGSLVARDEVLVAPEIEGFKVLELLVDEGAIVKKGDVLARLVSDTLEAQLAQNQATIARGTASIAQAKSTVVAAEAKVSETQNAFDRGVTLKRSGTIDTATYETRESAAKSAEANLSAAREAVRSAEADRAASEAARRELMWRQSKTEVRAPTDGLVSRRSARIGAVATAIGDPMFRIIAGGAIELEADLPETQLSRIAEGQVGLVTAAGGVEAEGKVRMISPEVDKTTRQGRVRILLNPKPGLRIGSFGRGLIKTARGKGVIVPLSSILYLDAGAFVQRVSNATIVSTPVTTGLVEGDQVLVTAGLSEGDLIVAKAGTFLRNGDAIRPVAVKADQTSAAVNTEVR